jgi:hypothetical protein
VFPARSPGYGRLALSVSLAPIVAAGIYIGGGVILAILIVAVLILLLRR